MPEGSHFSLFSDFDISLFKAGKHYRLYEKLGSHITTHEGELGTYFAVWAPSAAEVSVICSSNGWDRTANRMNVRWDSSGIWEIFIPRIGKGEYYKYWIRSNSGFEVEKADPYATHCETPPRTASIVWDARHEWKDNKWVKSRESKVFTSEAISVYEVHLGSWRRVPEEENRSMTYNEMAEALPAYCQHMGFTHVEFLPVMEHPFYGSWGYQITGYFAPSSRFGTPEDFMKLIDALHAKGIGVILDWVPSHFPGDEHGLVYFDGSHLYEHSDPRKGYQNDWKSYIFNYGRNEVKSFLISNALYWLDRYHIDGLRVDAVASMLYLDYSRKHGEWEPNIYGGRENLDAVDFLKELNTAVHSHHPGIVTIAEESTAWPGVSGPIDQGGLGFDMKWMMGWMHDTLYYFAKDPIYRTHHQQTLSFSIYYAFSEKFLLPLSHDEVVYGKGSMIRKMAGDEWQKYANLRLLYSYMYMHPGAKLLFMGAEFAQDKEWNHDQSLDWHDNLDPKNQGIQTLVKDLNQLYSGIPALHEFNFSPEGFEWIDFEDSHNSVICWVRKGHAPESQVVVVANFTPQVLRNYRIGVPSKGTYVQIFNSDSFIYGGSGQGNDEPVETRPIPKHQREQSVSLVVPPLGLILLRRISN